MKTITRKMTGTLLAAALASLAWAGSTLGQTDKASQPAKKPDTKKVETADPKATKDVLILRTGSKVEGKIKKESDKTIDFIIMSAGGLSAERSYDKADILEIMRNVPTDGPAAKPAATPSADGKKDKGTSVIGEGGTKIYLMELTGEFTRDVALTPMKTLQADVRKIQPDVIIIKLNCDYVSRDGQKLPDWARELGAFDQLEVARQIEVLFTDQIEHDPAWKVKPRLVYWVQKALGGVAFLPFSAKEIYYTSDAKHGGIGYLDFLFAGIGDEVVRQKQRSLREGRAEGLAVKGGHPVEILRAMARMDYVLSVTYVEGKPVFHEDESGDILLTDDGSMEAGRRDTFEDALRGKGNDVLTLDAEMAKKLGMSNGTVDDEKELITALGFERNYTLTHGKSKELFTAWSKGLHDAEIMIRKLFRDVDKVEVKAPGGWQQRQDARNKQIAILQDILALLAKYKEGINPIEIQADPEQMEQEIRIQIEAIKQAIRLDKRK